MGVDDATSPAQYFRNRLDLTDRVQVRVLRRRLRISDAELSQIVAKSGNSISAISKEVALQRTRDVATSVAVSAAAIVASDTNAPASEVSAVLGIT